MSEAEKNERCREQIHHMKMATLKDWLLNIEQDYINIHVDSTSILSDFEFYKQEEEESSSASSADVLFLEGKLLPLEALQNNTHNSASIPHNIADAHSDDIISPQHSRRFSPSDTSECMFSGEFPAADSTKRSWSLKQQQSKQSNNYCRLVQIIKASSGSFFKSLFRNNINSDSSDKDKSSHCSDSVGSEPKDASVEGDDARKGSIEDSETIKKSLHDVIGGLGRSRSCRRRSSFSGALKRHFRSNPKGGGNNVMVMKSGSVNSWGSSSNSSSLSLGLKRIGSDDEVEKSVDAAIAHCKLSLLNGSELSITPNVAPSPNPAL